MELTARARGRLALPIKAASLAALTWVVFASSAPPIDAAPTQCTVESEQGFASHVGPWGPQSGWEYPWGGVLLARQQGRALRGSITDRTRIDDPTTLVALHRVMHDPVWLGRWVLIEHVETGRQEAALVLDALAGNLAGEGALGWEPGVSYEGVIADLTPQQFGRLDESPTGWPRRGRIPVRVWYVECREGT